MIVNGVWNIESFPYQLIIEKQNGTLWFYPIQPLRRLEDKDLSPYKGYHPRKAKGLPLPEYLYQFYGLEKNTEALTEVIHIRITPTEKASIDAAAENDGLSTSEWARKTIRGEIKGDGNEKG